MTLPAVTAKDIGWQIYLRRYALRLTQRDLAKLASVHTNTVGRIERGRGGHAASVAAICNALGLTLSVDGGGS